MTVTPDILRRLLDGSADAELIVVEDRLEISEAGGDETAGLSVITREALVEQLGADAADVTDQQLSTAASALSDVVVKLGG